jgi:hypothetical protein
MASWTSLRTEEASESTSRALPTKSRFPERASAMRPAARLKPSALVFRVGFFWDLLNTHQCSYVTRADRRVQGIGGLVGLRNGWMGGRRDGRAEGWVGG